MTTHHDQLLEHKSILKTIIYFVLSTVVIVLSLIILLVNNKKLDKNINKCVLENSQIITSSNNLLLEIGSAQRRLISLAAITDVMKQKYILGRWKLAISTSKNHHTKIINCLKTNQNIEKQDFFIKHSIEDRTKYLKSSRKFIHLLKNHSNRSVISNFLIYDLAPKFKKYRLIQLDIFEILNEKLLTEIHSITNKASNVVWIVFSIGLFPFFFLGYRLFKP